ncbi:NAD(P)-dependent oxidoreductase [Vibrio diazotrophicus]|uniref:NAD(P)-dependent oxidoreductase n=1 Tax=Vibrio diazotrophicus TaxID=685 RepID=A0A2J8I1C7_VIBDI|nr:MULTISPECIES: NAD(P)-dependent oxidoreductase [Vibrio]MCF7363428.1 NAD(P)-dependent oxidoreductase [Vibrio sp. A1-b2]PNI04325.1 NAD(P)-dependent oxidoreductase [Vibrio diazotrophicus]
MNVLSDDLKLIEEKLAPIFPMLSNKRIFITGGTGFFGKWILETINYLNFNNKLNISATVLSRNPESFKNKNFRLCNSVNISFIEGDVRDFDYKDIRQEFDYIIHAATDASATLNRNNPELMRSTIMDGITHIIGFAKNVQCKKILYTSSGAAYGPQPLSLDAMAEDFTENSNFNLNDAYSSAKKESEEILVNCDEFETVIARCFAFSGPYLPLDGTYAYGNFISNKLKNEDIKINSSGESIRTYLYAADLVIWLFTILIKGTDKAVYNVGSDEKISILDLAKKISNDEIAVSVSGETGIGISRYVPDISKAKSELGLDVYTSVDNSILKTVNFYREN